MNSTKLEPHHLNLPTRRYIFLKMYTNLWKRINKQKWKPNPTVGPARKHTAAHDARVSVAQTRRGPGLAPASASATDKGAPRVSESDRGGRRDDGATRRRWQLRRGHWCYGVRLTRAHLVEPSIEAIAAAKGGGDGHGGARPRLGRLRRRPTP